MKSAKRSSAAAIIGGNDDLLIELILVFLPARSLIRLKLVSKRWRAIISSPSFGRRHTLHHPRRRRDTQHSVLLRGGESQYLVCHPTVRRLIPFRFGFPSVSILQSCNGLLLLRCGKTQRGRTHYCVFNPTTTQCRQLPPPPPRGLILGLWLMFDPRISLHYRVVGFLLRPNGTLIYVYDSETLQWRLGGQRMERIMSFRDGIYFNGGIYFLRVRTSSYRFVPDDDVSVIPHPPCGQRNYAMESNGFLLSLSLFSGKGRTVIVVHETKELIENGSWRMRYKVDLSPIMEIFGAKEIDLVGMIRGEKEEDSLLLLSLSSKIVICWLCDGEFEVLVDFTLSNFRFRDAHHLVHTLAPV